MPDTDPQDALTIARFIVANWPDLNAGIDWGDGVNYDGDPVHLAAQRLLRGATDPERATPAPRPTLRLHKEDS